MLNKVEGQYRQGDVIIVKVSADENRMGTPIKRDKGRVILAFGEVTGHHHAIHNDDVNFFQAAMESDITLGNRFLQVLKPAVLMHDEHASIDLPVGTYEVRIQREYTPEGLRNVAD